jgi:hypothetical protein
LLLEEVENNENDYYKVFGKRLRVAISASVNAGPDSAEAKHANECVRKDYETRFKNDDANMPDIIDISAYTGDKALHCNNGHMISVEMIEKELFG